MLGKFKSLFSKDAVELTLDSVPSAVSGLDDNSEKEKLAAAKLSLDKEAKKLFSFLEELSIKRADDNYVNVLKDRFCEKGIKLLSALPESYEEFIAGVQLCTQEISGISFKEFRHFQAFKEDMNRIASQLKVIDERLEDFRKLYVSSKQKRINSIVSLADSAKGVHVQVMRIDAELQEIEKAVPFIKEALESDERKLSEASNKVSSMEAETKEAVSYLESERAIIKQRIGTEFGSIDRLMKKLHHDSPKKHSLLNDYIANPGNAFISDEDLEIRTILENLKPAAKKEDPEKYEKILDLLRNIDFFDSLRQQYRGLSEKASSIRDAKGEELLPLQKEKSHMALSIDEKKAEITQLLDRRAAKAGEKEKLVQSLAVQRVELAERLQELMQREVRLV